jgi:hypothetical protein
MTWIVYHPATSNVLRLEETQPQEEAGLGYFFTTESLAFPVPTRAEHILRFDGAKLVWHDPRTLADHKAAQWELIKQARSQAEYAGFTWDGSTFDSDALSQNRITGAVTLAQMSPTFVINWILADNTTRLLDQSQMAQVGAALGAHVAAQFERGVTRRAQIEAATTAEQVAGIVW